MPRIEKCVVDGKPIAYTREPTPTFKWGLLAPFPQGTAWVCTMWFKTSLSLNRYAAALHEGPYATARMERHQ